MSNDEIVAALRYCQITEHSDCWGCPANIGSAGCLDALHKEAADVLEDQQKRIDGLEKKLSSAVHDLGVASECWSCKRNGKCHPDVSVKLPDVCCGNYKWRGVTDNNVGDKMTPTVERFLLKESGEIAPLTNCQQWIPVTERLPESGVRVIVCRGDKVESGVFLGVNGWWKVYGTNTKKVTHWMPLPEPPKGE